MDDGRERPIGCKIIALETSRIHGRLKPHYTRQSEQEVSQQCKAIEKMCSRLPKERNRLKTLIRILEAEFSSSKALLT